MASKLTFSTAGHIGSALTGGVVLALLSMGKPRHSAQEFRYVFERHTSA